MKVRRNEAERGNKKEKRKEIKPKQFSCASRSSFTAQIERQPWWLSAANISAPFHSSTAKHTSGQARTLCLSGIKWRLTLTTIKSYSIKNNETYYIHGFKESGKISADILLYWFLRICQRSLPTSSSDFYMHYSTLIHSLLETFVLTNQHRQKDYTYLYFKTFQKVMPWNTL